MSTNKKKYKDVLKELFSLAIHLLIALGITVLFITFIAQKTVVHQTSMHPTLENGDHLIVDKITYRFTDPKRFDIVIFPYKYAEKKNTYYIKRVIGLPGETVRIGEDGSIYINDKLLEENYGAEVINYNDTLWNRGKGEGITLGDGEYFVMGDNRNNSVDSRFDIIGNVTRKEIIGRAVFRLFPFKNFGPID
ncbi:MAG: signal peptidase I [Lachnospiraceae bacterium]|nr:signal peptidase I [Lachnospiraceae bacterium]MBQ8138185.1 signal peptidase I [Lachnospiraceae bacterium]